MINLNRDIPVIIVGGGPIGLFLGICLLKSGIDCKILEKRKDVVSDSRSIGIHSISLNYFDRLGFGNRFLEKGIKVKKGIALNEMGIIGEIDFGHIPKPHNYILICPQFETERILRQEIEKLNPDALEIEAEFVKLKEMGDKVSIHFKKNNEILAVECDFLIGCDGKNSKIREQASIPFSGKNYADTYVMGDFEDTTDFKNDAAVFLPKAGLIESFPLPNNMRRWVVKTDSLVNNPKTEKLATLISERIEHDLNGSTCSMLSSFGVQHLQASTFTKNRIVLAGDAAHVVSPIGGQGMNLGWIGAWRLAENLKEILSDGKNTNELNKYSNQQKKTVNIVARRAEMNMRLGRKQRFPVFRNLLVKGMLNKPFSKKTAGLFTMQGLVEID